MPKSLKFYADTDKAKEYRNRQRKKNYGKSAALAINKSRPYTEEEKDLILEHAVSDFELAQMIGRSVQAIQIARCKLRKIAG